MGDRRERQETQWKRQEISYDSRGLPQGWDLRFVRKTGKEGLGNLANDCRGILYVFRTC